MFYKQPNQNHFSQEPYKRREFTGVAYRKMVSLVNERPSVYKRVKMRLTQFLHDLISDVKEDGIVFFMFRKIPLNNF